jgi:hypothetical protein
MESVSLANRWTVFGVPYSCPEGATGETGWNPGDHATQRSLCPERAHGTGVWSPFAPLGRGVVGWGDPGFRSAPPLGYRRAPRCGEGGHH